MMTMLRTCVFGAALLAATSGMAAAADQTFTLRLGSRTALTVGRTFATILIGDPEVVDVQERDSRSVVIEPLDTGATNLVFVDDDNIAIANVRIVVCGRAMPAAGRDDAECE